ncbi:hypothetical protein QM716_23845 [Rhodococcus sp. IEGM 1409]|nr:hypothetical protein [Rhodococcus sp. IEGM 1409]MDI9902891.1 hypothetical protein [Rhodococcus sp. IEGM 1409]
MIADALPVTGTCRLRYSRRRPDSGSDFQLIGEFGAYRPRAPHREGDLASSQEVAVNRVVDIRAHPAVQVLGRVHHPPTSSRI